MQTLTVLVIDDDVASVEALSYFLRKLQFRVVVANDAYSAMSQASKNSPDLVILDYEMPAGNGAMVYQRLQNLSQTANVPVIFISGLGVEALQVAVPPLPNLRYLAKPVEHSDVKRFLRELLPAFVDPSAPAPADEPLDLDS